MEDLKFKDLKVLLGKFFNLDESYNQVLIKIDNISRVRDFIILEYNINLIQLMTSFYLYLEDLLLTRLKII